MKVTTPNPISLAGKSPLQHLKQLVVLLGPIIAQDFGGRIHALDWCLGDGGADPHWLPPGVHAHLLGIYGSPPTTTHKLIYLHTGGRSFTSPVKYLADLFSY